MTGGYLVGKHRYIIYNISIVEGSTGQHCRSDGDSAVGMSSYVNVKV